MTFLKFDYKLQKRTISFILVFFSACILSQSRIINSNSFQKPVSLFDHSEISYSNIPAINTDNLAKLNFKKYSAAKNLNNTIPDTLQYAIIKFSVRNPSKKGNTFYIFAQDDTSFMQCFEKKGEKFVLIDEVGYATRRINSTKESINHQHIKIILSPFRTSQFFLVFKKYKYTLNIPLIELQSKNYFLEKMVQKSDQKIDKYLLFTTIIAGFQFALLLFGLSKIYFFGYKKIYIFFTMLCALFIFFYLSEINYINFENRLFPFLTNKMIYEALGKIFIINFNFLVISFFDLNKKSFLYRYLCWISVFWLILILVEAMPFIPNKSIIMAFRFILNISPIIDFATLSLIFYYAIQHREGYRRYLFIGIFALLISAFEVALPRFLNLIHLDPNWVGISKPSYLLLQICDNINFCFFFIAFILKDKADSEFHKKLENEHFQTIEKLEKVNQLVMQDNIILKNKSKIYLNELQYIKADDHYLNIFTKDGKNHFVRGRLSDIIQQLPPNFIKCHRSYIVNKNYIKNSQTKFLIMMDASEIPISRGFKI